MNNLNKCKTSPCQCNSKCNSSCRSQCNSIDEVLHSIALEEAALAHILNAEGEKVQKAVATEGVTIEDLLCINRTVASTIREVTSLENALLGKLETACGFDCHSSTPTPPVPCDKGYICINVFDCKTHTGLSGAKIVILKNEQIIINSTTDANGCFKSPLLIFGNYEIKIKYQNQCEQIQQICVNQKDCNNVNFCFNNCTPSPYPIEPQTISITGKVLDKCGKPVMARVCAKGLNQIEATTNECGVYEICGLTIYDKFIMSAFADSCKSCEKMFISEAKNNYIINIKLR